MEEDYKKYYELNKRALSYRNSRQYFIGDRLVRYGNLIKTFHIINAIGLIGEDAYRVIFKHKKYPSIPELNLDKKYDGERIAVYTAIYGKYDQILDPLYKDPMCDYYIFTDQIIPKDSIWQKADIIFPKEVNTPFLKNRYVKLLPHKIFKSHKKSVYIDGNIIITSAISLYFNYFESPIGIGMHKHPSNINLYEEVMYNKRLGKITATEGEHLIHQYQSCHMPKDYGMFECNVIAREHNNPRCITIMQEWWDELRCGVKRDQLYFTFVLYKLGYKFNDVFLIGENINSNPMFIRVSHK